VIATACLNRGAIIFIDIPSILIVLLVGGSLGMASYKGGGFVGYMKACKKHFISAGILGTVIGMIQILQNLSNPEHIGPGLAIALLTIFYGVILYCIADAISA